MMKDIALLGVLMGLPSSIASAAPFNGLSIGLQGGGVDRSTSLRVGNAKVEGSKTDVAYGAFMGIDTTIGSLVLGAQAEINGGAGEILANDGAGTFNTVDPKWGYALSARAGFLASPRTLIYGRVGYAAERSKEVFGGPTVLIIAIPPEPKWRGGLQIGGGAEFAATRKISVRAEYRHNDYSKRYKANQLLVGAAVHL